METSGRGLLVTKPNNIIWLNTNKQGKHQVKEGVHRKLNMNQPQNRAWLTYVGHILQTKDQDTYLTRMSILMGKQAFEIETFPSASLGPRLTEIMLCDSLVFISKICPEPGRNREVLKRRKNT